jgi:predicted Zn-dependent peptidase
MKNIVIMVLLTGVLMAKALPEYYEKSLENGLKIVAIPMHNKSQVVSTDIFYNVGSKDEVMGKSGIAHMLEHLNFKSTKNLKAGEFDEIVKGFGGTNNASTGFDYTHYYIKSSSGNFGKALELFAELMQNLNLKDEEFQPERDVVTEERRWRTDNSPMGFMYFKLFNLLYNYNSYHWTPIGFYDDIRNWSIEDIRSFHDIYYQPKNAVIVVSGDIDKDEVFKEATAKFKAIKNHLDIPKDYKKEPKQNGEKRAVIIKDSQVQMLAIAYHIPDFLDKDQLYLSAISQILSSGKTSRLQKRLVEKKQLVNQLYAYNMELYNPGIFLIMAVCNPGVDATIVEKEILDELEKLKNRTIKKKELDKIKINTKASFVYSMENSSSVSNLFGSYFIRGDIKPLVEYEEAIEKIDKVKIQEVAKKYFVKSNSTTLILKGHNQSE